MTRLPRILPFALFAAALFVFTPLPARGAHKAEVPVPRGGAVEPIDDFSCGPVVLRSVKLEGAPDPSDVKEARKSDPDDETKLRWIFGVGNGGREKRKVTIRVVVFDRDGKVITKDERSDSVSGETADDHISVWTKIRTRAWPRADHIGVSVRCSKD